MKKDFSCLPGEMQSFYDGLIDEGYKIKNISEIDHAQTFDGENVARIIKVDLCDGKVKFFVVSGFYWEIEGDFNSESLAYEKFQELISEDKDYEENVPYSTWKVYDENNNLVKTIHSTSIDEDDITFDTDDELIINDYGEDGNTIIRYDYNENNILEKETVIFPEEEED